MKPFLFRMPWKTHAALTVACPVIMLMPAWSVYGFAATESPVTQLVMSVEILVFAWVVVAGMVGMEIALVACRRVSEARVIACAAHAWLALVGTAPVWFAFFVTDLSPIEATTLLQVGCNYAILLAGYLFATAAAAVVHERIATASSTLTP